MANKKVPVIISFEALDKVSGPIRQLAQRFEATKAPINRFQNSIARLYKGSGLAGLVTGFKNVFAWIGKITLGLTAMGFAAYYAFQRIVGDAVKGAARLNDVSIKTGIAVEEIQKWRFAAEQSGASTEEMDSAFVKFSRSLSDAKRGTGDLVQLLGKDSPLLQRITKKDTASALADFMDTLATIPDEADAIRLGMAGLGRGADGLITLAKEGKANREELFKQAEAVGLLTKAEAEMADRFEDTENRISRRFDFLRGKLVMSLLPAIQQVAEKFESWLTQNGPAIQKLAQSFGESLPKALDACLVILDKMGAAVQFLSQHTGFISTAFDALSFIIARISDSIENGPIGMAFKLWKAGASAMQSWQPVGAYAPSAPAMSATPPNPNPASSYSPQASVRMVIEGAPKGTRLYTEKADKMLNFETFMGMKMGGEH